MSLNSHHLDAFYTCAQIGSFTKAAKRLHISQSALSQRIHNLEEDLGTTLLVREKNGVRLTEFGENLLRYCVAKNAAESDLLAPLKARDTDRLSGIIRLGAFSSVARSLVLPALAPLLIDNPQVQFRLVVRELYELMPLLRSAEIDFLISTDSSRKPGMVSQLIGHEENVLVQKKGYRGADIYLDHDEDDTTTYSYLGKKDAKRLQRRYLDDVYGIIEGVKQGLGKAVVPKHLVAGLPELQILDPQHVLRIPIVLHYFEQPLYSKLHHAVVLCLTQSLSEVSR